jgi:serine/threonine-protein phosphatase 6 regulatory subunit 3
MLRNLGFRGLHKKKSVLNGNIDKMINENNDISLEEILAEDTIIDEVENQNKTLMKYLKKDKIKQMIDYIIKEPPNDASQDKGYKFPWICSQIFNLGDSNIMKYFLKTNKELEEEKKKEEERENNKNEQSSENSKTDDDKNKKNKKININEIVRQKGKENKIELLDYLLTFLSSDSEPNYVLCGYFASIIKTLLNMDQTLIIKYLYVENKEFIRKLIYHSYRQSISEILNKIVQYDSNEEEFNIEDMALIRMDILEGLFDKIDANMDNEKLDSISTLIKSISTDEKLLSDMLNNKKIIECLVTRPLRNINLVSKDNINDEFIINKRRNFDILIDIIINWINSINSFDIDIPSTDGSDDENENENENEKNNINYKHTILSYELFKVLGNLIKVNFNKNDEIESNENKILQCFDEKFLVPLGLFRIKIVELLGNLFTYFKNIPQLYDKLLIDCQFFENAFKYLFEYELNNIYQDALLSLFKKFLNYSDKHPLLAEFLFEKLNLIDLIISKLKDTEISQKSETPEDISKKDRFLYQSGNTTSRGYIAFLISLSYKINTIIGGEPLRINNTLSREGSISFITRTAPFVGKEEINEFYGMEEDELYEAVSHESNEKTSKLNCAVKSMEKYLNDKWNDFFYDHIADKIRLYETKLYKDDRRDSIFHNPFVLENDDENLENNRQNNFGLGEDEDEDVLGKQMRKSKNRPDFEKILYGDENDADMDINLNNRFKMSMRLPRSNKNNNNNNNMKVGGKRGSWGSKPAKVVVDEIDDIVDNKNKNEENNNEEEENPLDKFNKENKNENEEEENPLDKFRRGTKNNNKDENLLDKFRNNKNNDDNLYDDEEEENPLDKFRRENDNGNDEDENPLDKLKKFKTNNKENDNPLDKFKDNGINIYEDEEEEENPLDKFKRENKK